MKIKELRKEISDIDEEILRLFERRLELVRQVGDYKKANGLPVKNAEVEQEKLKKLLSECDGDNKEYVEKLYRGIFDICCEYQTGK